MKWVRWCAYGMIYSISTPKQQQFIKIHVTLLRCKGLTNLYWHCGSTHYSKQIPQATIRTAEPSRALSRAEPSPSPNRTDQSRAEPNRAELNLSTYARLVMWLSHHAQGSLHLTKKIEGGETLDARAENFSLVFIVEGKDESNKYIIY